MAVPPPARLRRGLPRVPGGTGWPDVPESVLAALAPETAPESVAADPFAAADVINESDASAESTASGSDAATATGEAAGSVAAVVTDPGAVVAAAVTPVGAAARIRKGLPRVAGGAPWPDIDEATLVAAGFGDAGGAASEAATDSVFSTETFAPAVNTDGGIAEVVPAESATIGTGVAASTTAPAGAPAPASVRIRKGLPRVVGGALWPDIDEAALVAAGLGATAVSGTTAESVAGAESFAPSADAAAAEAALAESGADAPAASTSAVTTASPTQGAAGAPVQIRKGLPRVTGGPRWPDIDPASLPVAAVATVAAAEVSPSATAAAPSATTPVASQVSTQQASAPAKPVSASPGTGAASPSGVGATVAPSTSATAASAATTASAPTAPTAPKAASAAPKTTPATSTVAPAKASTVPTRPATTATPAKPATPTKPTSTKPAAGGTKAKAASSGDAKTAKKKYHGFTIPQWVGIGIGLVVVVVVGSLAVRGLLTFQWAHDFVTTYPGDYALPAWAPTGQPLWLEWQHFFNIFFMLLIIRTGIQVRREVKPKASWMPKWDNRRKISLTVWVHQSLDLLWFVNGLVFWVALFATGQWVKLVPTSWAVFPNAISAGLKYATFTMPPGDGWANYNSLQQLTYFVVVFLLAPVSVLTGFRMSGLWPKNSERLNKLYPAPVARAIHFPAMICFVVFVFIHVVLVFATGALQNLNHMFGHRDVVSWFGCGIFAIAVLILVAAWVALRPLIIAPIASLFGKVGR